MAEKLQKLPGFRDFYPESCAVRNYIFETWRQVAARYRFREWEGPILEPTDLYRKKSGNEITEQLFCFDDKGKREVSMRPELTPTLARMAAEKHREYRKPMRWFGIGPFFRFERHQRGRTREFYQFNCDVLGDASPLMDAELIALAIDLMRAFGFTKDDFQIRLSSREAWRDFLKTQYTSPIPDSGGASTGNEIPEEAVSEVLTIIDRWEKLPREKLKEQLSAKDISIDDVEAFMNAPAGAQEDLFTVVKENLNARGLWEFVKIDLSIARGLAYYTGTVFEIFDIGKGMRAVAGGGRYDKLVELVGGTDLPAVGFAMGDVVIGDLIQETPHANAKLEAWLAEHDAIDAYAVVANEEQRNSALAAVQGLRDAGVRVDYPFEAMKVGKQFQAAEQANAKLAVVFGAEFPLVKIKNMADRTERECQASDLVAEVLALLNPANDG